MIIYMIILYSRVGRSRSLRDPPSAEGPCGGDEVDTLLGMFEIAEAVLVLEPSLGGFVLAVKPVEQLSMVHRLKKNPAAGRRRASRPARSRGGSSSRGRRRAEGLHRHRQGRDLALTPQVSFTFGLHAQNRGFRRGHGDRTAHDVRELLGGGEKCSGGRV